METTIGLRIRLRGSEEAVEVRDLQRLEGVRDAVRGAELVFPQPTKKEPSQSLLRRRAYLSRRAEQREYERMTASFRQKPRDNVVSSMQYQITVAANMIVAPVASFFIFYIFARAFTAHRHWRIAAGLFGLILMLVIEMILFITRSYAIDTMINNNKSSSRPKKNYNAVTTRTNDAMMNHDHHHHQQSKVGVAKEKES